MASWIRLLTAEVRKQPTGDIHAILNSQELSAALGSSLGRARSVAEDSLAKVWPDSGSQYRASLEGDISRAYGQVPDQLWGTAISAFGSVPPERRAAAVSAAVVRTAWDLGLRNGLTVAVARTRRAGEEVLSRAGPGQKKIWITRDDSRVCAWCRLLASLPAIPVDQEFSYGQLAGARKPPKVYHDLLCPPAHPRCRCRLRLVRADWVRLTYPAPEPDFPVFMTAGQVRDIPGERYYALREFQAAALRELGQAMRRLGGEA
jgi:hypothetical protein